MTSSAKVGQQVARFAAAGVVNTLVDYVLFLVLTSLLRLPLHRSWIAKAISGAVAMINSFILNRRWVFRGSAGGRGQLVRFFVVTLIGTFVVQLGGTHALSALWPGPGQVAFQLASIIGLPTLAPRFLSEEMVIRTVAFGLATIASMCWNFIAYRRWVFAPPGAALSAASASETVPASV